MVSNSLREQIVNIIAEVSPVDVESIKVSDDTSMDELMFDSIVFIEYILKLEDYFGISIDDDMLSFENFDTISKSIDSIVKIRNKQG